MAWPLSVTSGGTVQNESRRFSGMSFKNLAIKLRSSKCFGEGILLLKSMWTMRFREGFGGMQRDVALRGLRVDGRQVSVLEVLHDLLGQLRQHGLGQGLLGGLQARGADTGLRTAAGDPPRWRLGCPQRQAFV